MLFVNGTELLYSRIYVCNVRTCSYIDRIQKGFTARVVQVCTCRSCILHIAKNYKGFMRKLKTNSC